MSISTSYFQPSKMFIIVAKTTKPGNIDTISNQAFGILIFNMDNVHTEYQHEKEYDMKKGVVNDFKHNFIRANTIFFMVIQTFGWFLYSTLVIKYQIYTKCQLLNQIRQKIQCCGCYDHAFFNFELLTLQTEKRNLFVGPLWRYGNNDGCIKQNKKWRNVNIRHCCKGYKKGTFLKIGFIGTPQMTVSL